jgi:hypothetical protein
MDRDENYYMNFNLQIILIEYINCRNYKYILYRLKITAG